MIPTPAKSLLVGASGQIGKQILHLLSTERALVTARTPQCASELPLDLAELASERQADILLKEHPLTAIYCIAGMTNVEACEDVPERAHLTNCRGPEMLARVASARSIPFVYFSTEYVFDGLHGPYSEDAVPNPISVYGKSKWDGERAVLAACSHALVLRTTVVYGEDSGHKNFVYSVIRSLAAGKAMRVPNDQISTPTYNVDLALGTIALVARQASGTYHACGPERMSRLELARAVASYFSLDESLLHGVPTSDLGQKAPRPLSAGLSIEKLRRMHPDLPMRTVAGGLGDSRQALEDFLHSCNRLGENGRDRPYK